MPLIWSDIDFEKGLADLDGKVKISPSKTKNLILNLSMDERILKQWRA